MGSIKRNLANNITTGGAFDATDLSGTIPSTNVADASLTNLTTFGPALGDTIESVASDPVSATEGQFWYNSTSGVLKGLVQLKAWSAAANLPVARDASASDGTSTAGWIAAGSNTPAANTGTTATEEYSGFTWAAGGNLNTARTLIGGSGFGTQTAAAVAGGATQPAGGPTRTTLTATEEYNGSTWTSVTGLPTATFGAAQCGIQTAGLSFTGTAGYGNPTFNTSLEYDGTNWTSGGNVNSVVNYQAAGIQTAALAMQASDTTGKGTEAYNGTSWTTVANRNTGRAQIVGFGTQALATLAGGYTAGPGSPQFTETEQWDGTAWSISTATLGTAARNGMGIGTVGGGTSGLYAGGVQTTYIANTQEFNSTIFSPATGAWASGGNMTTGRVQLAGAGTQTAGLAMGGETTVSVANTESYNGTSWSPVASMNTARLDLAGTGLQTAALAFGGGSPGNASESWNGSAWTSTPSLNTARTNLAGSGTQTAALAFGGYTDPTVTGATESYNGSSWTSSPNSLNTARRDLAGTGLQTTTLACGGGTGPTDFQTVTESYNGTSWTVGGNLNTARKDLGVSGNSTAAVAFGGAAPPSPTNSTATELYDGTAWTTSPPLASGQSGFGYSNQGTQTSALAFGGYGPGGTNNTEEWTGPQTTATASTLTTS